MTRIPKFGCTRCRYCSDRKSNVINHINNKNVCEPEKADVPRGIEKLLTSALIKQREERAREHAREREFVNEEGTPNANNETGAESSSSSSSQQVHIVNNIQINGNGNNVSQKIEVHPCIYKAMTGQKKRMHFPVQNTTHLSMDTRRDLAEEAINNGFRAAVKKLFDSKLYFDLEQPHNVNIRYSIIDGRTIIEVWNKNEETWIQYDESLAISEMLQEHGDVIRNLPYDLNLSKKIISKKNCEEIEYAFNTRDYEHHSLVKTFNENMHTHLRNNYDKILSILPLLKMVIN